MPKIVQTVRKPTPAPDAPAHPIGSMRPGKHLTSKLEEQVRAKLTAAGVELVGERHGIQCGFDEVRNKYPSTRGQTELLSMSSLPLRFFSPAPASRSAARNLPNRHDRRTSSHSDSVLFPGSSPTTRWTCADASGGNLRQDPKSLIPAGNLSKSCAFRADALFG